MAHVSVTIAGRAYRMACDEGQEEHLLELGRQLDGKIDQLRSAFGEIGDMRLSVMAGIMIADELSETQRRVGALQHDLDELRNDRAGVLQREEETQARVTQALDEAANRVEKLVDALSRTGV
ncbi:cell division protein ZapA [Labrys monachus]|uniref:Cell division protein ZapA n=1 Tax=Labrys monachus TaxID=217067 RepID=A0ABU0F8C7_9HYPH|nr:cell division protein ZapA [Labrys monachus]MDQ0390859.1 cell division protein ZapA [Labrys monachus]